MRCKVGMLGSNRQKGWDLSSASYVQRLALAYEPYDVALSATGEKMFSLVSGPSGSIREYDLSTPWDVSTAAFVRSLGIGDQDQLAEGLFIKGDGSAIYICGRDNNSVYQYSLPTPYSLLSASYVRSFSVSPQQQYPQALFFRGDGLRMYVAGSTDDRVHEYNLSTAWNISTASYSRLKNVSTEVSVPSGLFFRPNGTHMYVADSTNDDITEYALSAAWDVTSATYVSEFSVASQGSAPVGVAFDQDGFRMYVAERAGEEINQYSLK